MRSTVKQWIVDHLSDRLDPFIEPEHPLGVDNGWPGKRLERDHVWADRVTGTKTFQFIQAGTKTCDDQFTVRLIFQASGPADSIAECDARVEQYVEEFVQLIAEDPSLGDMDGLIAAFFGDDSVEGPSGEWTDEGAVSFMFADLSVHTRT